MIYPVSTHLYAWINDSAGNRMNICNRVEFCANGECIAAVNARWFDFHYLVDGASLLILPATRVIVAAGYRVSYSSLSAERDQPNPQGPGDPVKIVLSTYSWVGLLRHLAGHTDWRVDGIRKQMEPVDSLTAERLAAVMKAEAGFDYAT